MLYPSINLLKTKADSRYTLVVMAAKRARHLIDGKPKLTLMESNKPVSIATFEISDDLISYSRAQTSAKNEPELE
jgi:DNA-directed RNA polymerase subunit omega